MEQQLSKSKKFALWMDSHFQQYKRVWRLLRKPTMQEFSLIAKVSAIGLLVIGAIGFVISLIVKVGLAPIFG